MCLCGEIYVVFKIEKSYFEASFSLSPLYLLAMERINYSSGSKWEHVIGYSRAVKIGNLVEVTGTVAAGEDGKVVGKEDAYVQTKYIYEKIRAVLERAGASMKDVIRVRMYVTDISRWQEYGKAHSEFFREIKPCNTMVEVNALIEQDYLIEIEATAIISS